jgi:hypothetical protein
MLDATVSRWRDQVRDGIMSIVNYVWNCGIHYGYDPCCIKNYINLQKLGYAPGLFMSTVLGHDNRAPYVLCPMCNDEWDGERREPEYDLTRQNVVDDMKKYKLLRDNLI